MTDEPKKKDGPQPSLRFGGLAQQQQAVKPPDKVGRTKDPVIEAPERLDAQTPERSDVYTRKRQTVYLTPGLIRRIKHYVADSGEEISEVAEQALIAFLDRMEGR